LTALITYPGAAIAAHRGNIMKNLRVHKTADLVKYAIRNGLAGIA
jgi:DNA-binding NarL/FixJ family response regulator